MLVATIVIILVGLMWFGAVLISGRAFVRGLMGTRRGGELFCRACKYSAMRAPWGTPCSECGADLTRSDAMQRGMREPDLKRLGGGGVGLAICFGMAGVLMIPTTPPLPPPLPPRALLVAPAPIGTGVSARVTSVQPQAPQGVVLPRRPTSTSSRSLVQRRQAGLDTVSFFVGSLAAPDRAYLSARPLPGLDPIDRGATPAARFETEWDWRSSGFPSDRRPPDPQPGAPTDPERPYRPSSLDLPPVPQANAGRRQYEWRPWQPPESGQATGATDLRASRRVVQPRAERRRR